MKAFGNYDGSCSKANINNFSSNIKIHGYLNVFKRTNLPQHTGKETLTRNVPIFRDCGAKKWQNKSAHTGLSCLRLVKVVAFRAENNVNEIFRFGCFGSGVSSDMCIKGPWYRWFTLWIDGVYLFTVCARLHNQTRRGRVIWDIGRSQQWDAYSNNTENCSRQ